MTMFFQRKSLWLGFLLLTLSRLGTAELIEYGYAGPGIQSIPDTGQSFFITASFSLDESLFGETQTAQDLFFDIAAFSDSSVFFIDRNEVTTDNAGNIVDLFVLFGGVDESLSMTESNWEYVAQGGFFDDLPAARIESTEAPTISVPEPTLGHRAVLFLLLSAAFLIRWSSRK